MTAMFTPQGGVEEKQSHTHRVLGSAHLLLVNCTFSIIFALLLFVINLVQRFPFRYFTSDSAEDTKIRQIPTQYVISPPFLF